MSGDLVALAHPVTKWTKEVRRGEDVGQALRRAFAIARTAPSGPVFLSLPMDVLDQEVSAKAPPKWARRPMRRVSPSVSPRSIPIT
jgi:benzoylformate decarboxylase